MPSTVDLALLPPPPLASSIGQSHASACAATRAASKALPCRGGAPAAGARPACPGFFPAIRADPFPPAFPDASPAASLCPPSSAASAARPWRPASRSCALVNTLPSRLPATFARTGFKSTYAMHATRAPLSSSTWHLKRPSQKRSVHPSSALARRAMRSLRQRMNRKSRGNVPPGGCGLAERTGNRYQWGTQAGGCGPFRDRAAVWFHLPLYKYEATNDLPVGGTSRGSLGGCRGGLPDG